VVGRSCRFAPFWGDDDFLVEEVGDGYGFVAVGAWPADAYAAGEGAALLAALFAVQALAAGGAFVDGDLS
jgi:hypothetical protein